MESRVPQKQLPVFSRAWCYTVLEMGWYVTEVATTFLRTLYMYFLCRILHASIPFYES
jgi:hypothetical protein